MNIIKRLFRKLFPPKCYKTCGLCQRGKGENDDTTN